MAIVFPISPSVNDTFTSGSITYKWDGDKWIGLGVTPADKLIEGSNSLEITAGNDLVWTGDAVGLKNSSPVMALDIGDGTQQNTLRVNSSTVSLVSLTSGNTSQSRIEFGDVDNDDTGYIYYDHSDDSMRFATNGSNERLRIRGQGPHLLLGTGGDTTYNEITESSSNAGLVIGSGSVGNGGLVIRTSNTGTGRIYFADNSGGDAARNIGFINYYHSDDSMRFQVNGNERLRIKSNGVVQIGGSYGNDNGSRKLEVFGPDNSTSGILLANSAVSASGTCDISLAPSNGITGAQIFCHAKADFTTGGNRTADLAFVTRNAGTLAETARMSAAGYFTVPRQPSFRVGRNTNYTPGALTDIIFNITNGTYHHNNGGHYSTSNGRFTAPVAGMYTFSAHVIWQSLTSGQQMDDAFSFMVNGSTAGYSFRRAEFIEGTTGNSSYFTDFGSYDVYLEANEYVTIRNRFGSLTVHGNQYYTTFSGCLIA